MIEIKKLIDKETKTLKVVEILGHSSLKNEKNVHVLCVALSFLVKYFVIGLETANFDNFKAYSSKNGEFKIEILSKNLDDKVSLLIDTFEKSLEWLNDTYKNELKFIVNYN